MTKSSSSPVPPPVPTGAKPALPIPRSAGTRFKRERIKSPKHEQFIRSLPCVICGDNTTTECAHVSYADLRYGKMGRGMGQKEESVWVVPLCGVHHREQHQQNEKSFWMFYEIDPCRVAACLFIRTQDHQAAHQIIQRARD